MIPKTHNEFCKVIGLGSLNFDLILNLNSNDVSQVELDLTNLNTIEDCDFLFKSESLKQKFETNLQSNLAYLLLFVNKTHKNKFFVEFLSLNSLFDKQDLLFLKDKAKNYFDNNFLFLFESNLIKQEPFRIILNFEGVIKTIGESNKTHEYKKLSENSQNNDKIIKNNQFDNVTNSQTEKKAKINDQDLNKKNTQSSIPYQNNNSENHIKDSKSLEIEKFKPSQTVNQEGFQSPIIPKKRSSGESKISENNNSDISKNKKKGELELKGLEKQQNQETDNLVQGLDSPNEGNDFSNKNENILMKINYDFNTPDYMFLDINEFLGNEIGLFSLVNFMKIKQSALMNISIVAIFPNLSKIATENLEVIIESLVEIMGLCDVIVFEKKDSMILCSALGYKVEEKNFEARFMFLKELNKSHYTQKTYIFLEEFKKITIIMQETKTGLIIYHNHFNFDIEFNLDYLDIFITNRDLLKSVFLGGFFSGVIQNKTFEISFKIGVEIFKKMFEIVKYNLKIPDDPEYFVIKPSKLSTNSEIPSKIHFFDKKSKTTTNFNVKKIKIKDRENNFVIDSIKVGNLKGKNSNIVEEYLDKIKDKSNKIHYSKESKFSKTTNNFGKFKENSLSINTVELEQKKLMSILQANEKIQEKLNKILSSSPEARKLFEKELKSLKAKKLPSLKETIEQKETNIQKVNLNQKLDENYTKIKNLKPISQEVYNRLTGNNKKIPSLNDFNSSLNINIIPSQELKKVIDNNQESPIKIKESNNLILSNEVPIIKNNDEASSPKKVHQINEKQENKKSRIKQKTRFIRHLIPICNLGISQNSLGNEFESSKPDQNRRNEFKDYIYFDSKYRKNKGLDRNSMEKNKTINYDTQEAGNQKGRKEDLDDLPRILEKMKNEKKKFDEYEAKKHQDELKQIEESKKEIEINNKNLISEEDKLSKIELEVLKDDLKLGIGLGNKN